MTKITVGMLRGMTPQELAQQLRDPQRPSMVKDYTGRKNGRLVVTKFLGMLYGAAVWEALCECGNVFPVDTHSIERTRSCGCLAADRLAAPVHTWADLSEHLVQPRYAHVVQQLAGQKFGHLEVMRLLGVLNLPGYKTAVWACRCVCGVELPVSQREWADAKVTSCGCTPFEAPVNYEPRPAKQYSSKYRCVRWSASTKKWTAKVGKVYLGVHSSEEEAARICDVEMRKQGYKVSKLNFPEPGEQA